MFWKLFEVMQDTTAAPSQFVIEYLTPIVRQAVEEKRQNEKDGADGEDTLLKHMVQSSDGMRISRTVTPTHDEYQT